MTQIQSFQTFPSDFNSFFGELADEFLGSFFNVVFFLIYIFIPSGHHVQYLCTFCSRFGLFMLFDIEVSQFYILKSSISS